MRTPKRSLPLLESCLLLCIVVVCLLFKAPIAFAEEESTRSLPPALDRPPARIPYRSFKPRDPSSMMTASNALYPDNPACSQAKLALWLAPGPIHVHGFFWPTGLHITVGALNEGGSTIIIGAEGCRVRISIERMD
jgi:hypothetical protein